MACLKIHNQIKFKPIFFSHLAISLESDYVWGTNLRKGRIKKEQEIFADSDYHDIPGNNNLDITWKPFGLKLCKCFAQGTKANTIVQWDLKSQQIKLILKTKYTHIHPHFKNIIKEFQ